MTPAEHAALHHAMQLENAANPTIRTAGFGDGKVYDNRMSLGGTTPAHLVTPEMQRLQMMMQSGAMPPLDSSRGSLPPNPMSTAARGGPQ